jgi:hypothetical protein
VRTRDWVERKEARDAIEHEIDQARAEQRRLETLRSKLERVRRLAPYLKELTFKEARSRNWAPSSSCRPAYADG